MRTLLTLCLLLFTATVHATTYYVATTGSDSNTCAQAQSISTPKKTIAYGTPANTANSGINCLAPGDTLLIRAGTYVEEINTNRRSLTTATGTSWATATTISRYQNEVVTLSPAGTSQSGAVLNLAPVGGNTAAYIIFNGLTLDGTATCCDATGNISINSNAHHLRFTNLDNKLSYGNLAADKGHDNEWIDNVMHDNATAGCVPAATCTDPHGLYSTGQNTLIQGNTFYNVFTQAIHVFNGGGCGGTCTSGTIVRNNIVHDNHPNVNFQKAGILLGSGANIQVYNNTIYNEAIGITIYTNVSNAAIYNNVIYNIVNQGIVSESGSNNKVYNNTIYKTTGTGSQAIWMHDSISPAIQNNILYNTGGVAAQIDASVTGVTFSNNLCSSARTGCTVAAPNFVDAASGNFHLTVGSPAIDQGTSTAPTVTDDKDGVLRPQGAYYDIGAYELGTTNPCNP